MNAESRFNPNHDSLGQFSKEGGAGGGIDFGDIGFGKHHAPAKARLDKHHGEMSKGWLAKLGEAEKEAVKSYAHATHKILNAFLRHGKADHGAHEGLKAMTHHLDRALDKAHLKEDTVVYRGVSNTKHLGRSLSKIKGAILRDKGFLSTSLNKDSAASFIENKKDGAIFRIHAPKGAKGASLHGVSNMNDEHEVLFHRNTPLKITGHSKDEKGRKIIHAIMNPE